MKHVVGILAHKNPEQVLQLISELEKMGIECVIHWDLKSLGLIDSYTKLKDLSTKSYSIHRGHISLIHASLELMKEAQLRHADYFHLISGEDIVVKAKLEWDRFFEQHEGVSFINYKRLADKGTRRRPG